MISCIICSRKEKISPKLVENLNSTIGCDFETIVIDNSKNKYSIFSAYNEGILRAQGDVLCFMHEDVCFHSNNWGQLVFNVLNDDSIGILGIIGSQFLPNVVSSWWICGSTKGQLIQGYKDKKGRYISSLEGEKVDKITDLVIIDGFWFCMTKAFAKEIYFDDRLFNSFHAYDMDICMQTLKYGKRVVVAPNILIEHFSMGNTRESYFNQLELCFYKWKDYLPIWRGINISTEDVKRMTNILRSYQNVIRRNIVIENSKAYKIGRILLYPLKKIMKFMK